MYVEFLFCLKAECESVAHIYEKTGNAHRKDVQWRARNRELRPRSPGGVTLRCPLPRAATSCRLARSALSSPLSTQISCETGLTRAGSGTVCCVHILVFKFSRVRLVFRKSLSYLVSRFSRHRNSGKRSERRPGRNADSSLIPKKMKRKIA